MKMLEQKTLGLKPRFRGVFHYPNLKVGAKTKQINGLKPKPVK